MKHRISCSNNGCIHHDPFHNRCYLRIVCIGKNGECVSFTTDVPYNEPSPNEMDEHTCMC